MGLTYANQTQQRSGDFDPLLTENDTASAEPQRQRGQNTGAAAGSSQGGLLNWFRGLFSSNAQPRDEQPQNEETEAPPQDAEEEQQWVEDTYAQVNPAFITDHPLPGSPLAERVRDYSGEGPGQAPIFETHSFMPRESKDGVSALHLHSFVGFRFTQLDPQTHTAVRKRLKVGFGGAGSPFSDHGRLMDDNETQADMSTQTPITRNKLEHAMSIIPGRIAQPYNVLTHNCNHFTQELAQEMGAAVPAKLHDSALGPMGAYKNLANGAENGEQARTRFFQGGGIGNGQMAQDSTAVTTNFMETAKSAARSDGLPFMLYHTLRDKSAAVAQTAAGLERFRSKRYLEGAAETAQFEQVTENTVARAQELIGLHMWKGHPRVNMAAMKTIAIAQMLRRTFLPEKRKLTGYSQEELDSVLTQRTQAETDAELKYAQTARILSRTGRANEVENLQKTVTNEQLFQGNMDSMGAVGDVLLQSMGLSVGSLLREEGSEGETKDMGAKAVLARVASSVLGEDGMNMEQYLSTFIRGRDNLTDKQLASLATVGILKELCRGESRVQNSLRSLCAVERTLAQNRDDDSLDNQQKDKTSRIAETYTVRKAGANETEAAARSRMQWQETRQDMLFYVNAIEETIATKIQSLRTMNHGDPSAARS